LRRKDTTREPCTTRNHPKVPCAQRIIDRKVARVVIGMLDPDERICGRGVRRLRKANIEIVMFPSDLMAQVEDRNRDFERFILGAEQNAEYDGNAK
jgi:pyrimidine deaminase RibD-like protein